MRIVSFNIRSFRGMDNTRDPARTLQAASALEADLIGLQEVRKLEEDSRFPLEEMGERLHMNPYFAVTVARDGFQYGIGVLSRYPFTLAEELSLPVPEGMEPRKALILKILAPGGEFYFINTHLSSRNSGGAEARKKQVLFLLEHIEKKQYFPAVLTGDLNAAPDSEELSPFIKKWNFTGDNTPTFPADAPAKKLDHIAFFPKNAFREEGYSVSDDRFSSDHRAVGVTLYKGTSS